MSESEHKARDEARDEALSRQGRLAGLVIALTGALWVIGMLVGEKLGLPSRTRALFDLFALGGFAFGLMITWRIWRARRKDGS